MAEKGKHFTVSEQESNFLRFANLVIRICPKAVRAVFDKCFQPSVLGTILNQMKSKLEALCKKRIINKSQMDILYPAQGTLQVKSTDFDISLMLCLLRNIQNMQFPVELPKPKEVTKESDLSRINYYRNFVAHDSTGELGRETFKQAWDTLTKAVERLGGPDLKAECDHLLVIKLDSSFKEFYTTWVNHERRLDEQEQELKAVKSRVEELEAKKDHYKENLNHDVEEWNVKDKLFFNTTAVKNIEEEVKANSFVLISGASGMGKSASAFHIALKWKEKQNYEIISIIDPRDIITYASIETYQIFIVDDFCGKFVTDEQQCKAWQRLSVKLLAILKNHKQTTRIVGTCRRNISCTKQVQNLVAIFGIEVCDLLDTKYSVNLSEKRNIALQYMDEESLNKIDNRIIKQECMFPLLCSLSVKTAFDPELFYSPFHKYQEEFAKMHLENEACFFGLVLLVLNNNKLCSNDFLAKPSEDFIEIFDKVWEDTDLEFILDKPRKSTVLKHLKGMTGFIARENGNIISALHDKIFDFLAYFVCNKAPTCILLHGNIQFIQERVSFGSQRDKADTPFMIYLPENLEHLFFDRMLAAFKILLFEPFFENLLSDTSYYQEHMIDRIKKDNESLRIIVQNVWPLLLSGFYDNQLLHSFVVNKIKEFSQLPNQNLNLCILEKSEISHCEMRKTLNICQRKEGQSGVDLYLICLAIDNRQLCCLDLFLNVSTRTRDISNCMFVGDFNDNRFDEDDLICPLIAALRNYNDDGDISYFNLICPHISSTNFYVFLFDSVLHWICCKCHNVILDTVLQKLSFNVNIRDSSGRTPLYIACREGNGCCVIVLINHNCDVNIGNQDGVTPLMVACDRKNGDIVKTLLESGNCNPNLTDKLGDSALCRAAYNNSPNIADFLVKYGASVNTLNKTRQSPLHIAAMCGNNEMVKFLVKKTCSINEVDGYGKTPLALSCINGNEKTVQYLLNNNCSLNTQDTKGQTALHKAVISNFYGIVNLLVKTNRCIINVCDDYGYTPLHYAIERGHRNIICLLRSKGANINARDNHHVSLQDKVTHQGLK